MTLASLIQLRQNDLFKASNHQNSFTPTMSAKLELRELIVEPGARQIKLPSVISSPCYVDLGDDIIVTPRARGGSVFRTSQIAALPSGTTGCEMSLISPDVGRSVPARWRCFGGVIVRSLVLTSAQM